MELSAETILHSLRTKVLGREVHFAPQTGSTNEDARRLAQAGAPSGTLVVTEEQLAGRGRRGRRWLAPPGTSLLFSLLFRPEERWTELGMAAALGARQGIEAVSGLEVGLKWPNDLLVNGRKVGGVLVEAGTHPNWCIVGTGININWDPRVLPELVGASSLSVEAGRPLDRLPLLATILEAIEGWYERWRAVSILPEWRRHLETLGREVTVLQEGESWSGRAVDLDESGGLVVERPDGRRTTVLAGEVSLR